MRRSAPLALGLLLHASGALAAIPGGDYSLDPEAWNGLGYLLTTAEEAKVELEPLERLDLGRLRPADVLLWVYPEEALPTADLLAFVRDGGHLVLADDVGAAAELLSSVGIERRETGPAAHAAWYEGQEGLPLLAPQRQHFLFFNVEEVAANYPAVLRGEGEAILSTDDAAEALIVERRLGQGALLALGDPSLLLNEMLRRFYGNKQLAANIMRLYCDGDTCQVKLVLPGAEVVGRYRTGLGRLGRLPAVFEDAARIINEALARLAAHLGAPPWIHLVAWALLLLAVAGALLVAADRRRDVARPLLAPRLEAGAPPLEEAVGLVEGRRDADFAREARVLLDDIAESLDIEDLLPTDRLVPARAALLRIRREVDSLRGQRRAVVGADRFLRLVDDVRTVALYLDQHPRRGAPAARSDAHRPSA